MGKALRHLMLTSPPEEVEAKPTKEFPRVYAVLMDWPVGENTATVLSTSTGEASLYTTSTFGIIGGAGREGVSEAALKVVRAADAFFEEAKPVAKQFPYPGPEQVFFYFLTFEGVRRVEANLAAIESGSSPCTELFGLVQKVLTALQKEPATK